MADALNFSISTTRFDENYSPSTNSRTTTNFANLARGERREENLRNALTMINRRFNSLAHWDNPQGDRYSLELEIISANVHFSADNTDQQFPLLEVLETTIVDKLTGTRSQGMVGNNFSSYVRDYDFS
ncbi:putative oxygenase MesX, partial [Glutamicibacter arilaitensis]